MNILRSALRAALLAAVAASVAPTVANAQTKPEIAVAELRKDELRAEVRAVIEAQMAAFAADDGPAAYAFAAKGLQAFFRTPDRFMRMVRETYAPVYRPQAVTFGRFVERDGLLYQEVGLTGPKGKSWTALYSLLEHEDGLRITGCRLIKSEARGI